MSTYSTFDDHVVAALADEPAATHLERVLRVSVDLATGDVGLDVETRSKDTGACRLYERTVLTADQARAYAGLLNRAAAQADRIAHPR
jgi:hypothetical protein